MAIHTISTKQTMKNSAIIFPAKFFFLFLIVFTTRAHAEKIELVNDSEGRALINGGKYYILLDHGGSITAVDTSFCQISVIQLLHDITIPSKISTPYDNIGFVTTIFPISISFPSIIAPSLCINSNKWVVVDSPPLGQHVMLGAEKDCHNSVNGSFFFKTYDYGKGYYKPIFCTKKGDESECKNIGVQFDDEYFRRLVLTDHLDPLIFKFVKVEESSAFGDTSMVV